MEQVAKQDCHSSTQRKGKEKGTRSIGKKLQLVGVGVMERRWRAVVGVGVGILTGGTTYSSRLQGSTLVIISAVCGLPLDFG